MAPPRWSSSPRERPQAKAAPGQGRRRGALADVRLRQPAHASSGSFKHRPPYKQLWHLRARWFVEFPPVVGHGKLFVSQLKGNIFYARRCEDGGVAAGGGRSRTAPPASPALARHLVIETYIPQPCTSGPRGVPGR